MNEWADNVVPTPISESILLGKNPERLARVASVTVIIGHNDMPQKQMYIVHAVWKMHSDVELVTFSNLPEMGTKRVLIDLVMLRD